MLLVRGTHRLAPRGRFPSPGAALPPSPPPPVAFGSSSLAHLHPAHTPAHRGRTQPDATSGGGQGGAPRLEFRLAACFEAIASGATRGGDGAARAAVAGALATVATRTFPNGGDATTAPTGQLQLATGPGSPRDLTGMGRFGPPAGETADHHWRVTVYNDVHSYLNHYFYGRRADSTTADDRTHEHRHRTVTSHAASTQEFGDTTAHLVKYLHHEQHWNNHCQGYTHYRVAAGPTPAGAGSSAAESTAATAAQGSQNDLVTPMTQWDSATESHRWHHNTTHNYFHFHHGVTGPTTHTCGITSRVDGPHKHSVITNRYHYYFGDDQARPGDGAINHLGSGATGHDDTTTGTHGEQQGPAHYDEMYNGGRDGTMGMGCPGADSALGETGIADQHGSGHTGEDAHGATWDQTGAQ